MSLFRRRKHHHQPPPEPPSVPTESEPAMADFSNVSVSQPDPNTIQVTGQATTSQDQTVTETTTLKADDGSTDVRTLTGTRTTTGPVGTRIDSVTDDLGGTWTVSEDGQTATLQA